MALFKCPHPTSASLVAQTVKNLPTIQETEVDPWVGKIPWRRKWQASPVFLQEESHGQRSLVGYISWGGRVGQDWATNTFTFNTHFYPLNPAPTCIFKVSCLPSLTSLDLVPSFQNRNSWQTSSVWLDFSLKALLVAIPPVALYQQLICSEFVVNYCMPSKVPKEL